MANNSTSVWLEWDANGKIRHQLAGPILPGPNDNEDHWILAPVAPMFFTEHLAKIKPTKGLDLCSNIMDLVFQNKKIVLPIAPVLKMAHIDLMYNPDRSATLVFFPRHNLFYNKDLLEQATGQLVCNYYQYIYNRLTEYYRIVLITFTNIAVSSYLNFLLDLASKGKIGPNRDQWNALFSNRSLLVNHEISLKYYKPTEGDSDWADQQRKFLNEKIPGTENNYKELCKIMGMNN